MHLWMAPATWTDTDADLHETLGQGASEAIAAVYDRYSGLAYGLALRIVGDPGRAEDVVQEVFFGLWRRPTSFNPEKGSFRTWLMTLVRNRSIDSIRGRQRHEQREAELPEEVRDQSPNSNPWAAVALSLERDVVREAVATLPAEQRAAIELAHFGGYTHVEIADRLGLPLGTVKGRLRLGMEKLHAFLSARGVMGT
jgi:RNA polymerase sigma-70 factor (ECF subfamily)